MHRWQGCGSIFLSYDSSNAHRDAVRLKADLDQVLGSGFIWLDELDSAEIGLGTPTNDLIQSAIEQAEVFMVLVTPTTQESGRVAEEIRQAQRAERPIIPVLLDDASLPYGLAQLQPFQLSGAGGSAEGSWNDRILALADVLRQRLRLRRCDIVTIGRLRDAKSLSVGLAALLSSGVVPARCWGSGTGGVPLAVASFFGADEDDILALGQRLAAAPSMLPWQIVRRRVRGWTQSDRWFKKRLIGWFNQMESIARFSSSGDFRHVQFAQGDRFDLVTGPESTSSAGGRDEFHRPSDWLQLIALDLEQRHPVLLPRHFDEIGGEDSQRCLVSDLMHYAMGGLDGPRPRSVHESFPLHVADRSGRRREFTHYPGFRIPWSLQSEERSWPVVVLMPDERSRRSSYWWGLPVDEVLKPKPPDSWIVIELPRSRQGAKTIVVEMLQHVWSDRPSVPALDLDETIVP